MGVFFPLCIIQGGKSLYAFAVTRAYHDRTATTVYMLAKSNENPSHTLEDLTWTPVSVVSSEGYPVMKSYGTLFRSNCAIDVDTGVFTLFFMATDAQYEFFSVGIQYFPPGASGGNTQPPTNTLLGTGTWRNVTFPPDYQWPKSVAGRLFNYKDPQSNKSQLMHVYHNSSNVYVAALDPVTMTMHQGPSWTSTMSGFYPKSFSANSQNIYVLGENYTLPSTTALYQFPINSANVTDPPQPTQFSFNGTQTQCYGIGSSYYLFTFRENPLMACQRAPPASISLVNGTELTALPRVADGLQDQFSVSVFEIMDVQPVPFLIFQDTKRNTFSVPLSGSLAGVKISAKKNMTVTEDYGDYPPPSYSNGPVGPLTGWGSDLGKSGSKSSTGAIVGGVCAVVIVAIAVLGFLYYRRRRQWNNHQSIDKAKPNSPDSSSPSAAVAGPHLTQSWNQAPMQLVQPPPLQYLQVFGQDQAQQQHNNDHSNKAFDTQSPVTSSTLTYSGSLPGYSRYPPTSAPTPTVPVHTRPLTTQHGFP
ncbi:hypothetical protein B0O80DRAFT_486602 [Mortierella sp. GBAus27b]|nr:hypothetical protein BGX31_007659 [Mortierella sp. GBA43]KAI8355259.1 hypothetical protein B0O80DRAFT_486602 [Mortierella sp. GBAus27b]